MKLEIDSNALEDLIFWQHNNPGKAKKILKLLEDILKHPYTGLGKPEPLKYQLTGCWSRRIDQEHRVVYQVTEEAIIILQCRYHY